jgi:hypothetical protein
MGRCGGFCIILIEVDEAWDEARQRDEEEG